MGKVGINSIRLLLAPNLNFVQKDLKVATHMSQYPPQKVSFKKMDEDFPLQGY